MNFKHYTVNYLARIPLLISTNVSGETQKRTSVVLFVISAISHAERKASKILNALLLLLQRLEGGTFYATSRNKGIVLKILWDNHIKSY